MDKVEGSRKKTGGRKKGVPNKVTQDAKQAIEYVAQGLGGATGMLSWAQADPKNEFVFWSNIYPRILPKEIKAEVDTTVVVEVVKFATGQASQ